MTLEKIQRTVDFYAPVSTVLTTAADSALPDQASAQRSKR